MLEDKKKNGETEDVEKVTDRPKNLQEAEKHTQQTSSISPGWFFKKKKENKFPVNFFSFLFPFSSFFVVQGIFPFLLFTSSALFVLNSFFLLLLLTEVLCVVLFVCAHVCAVRASYVINCWAIYRAERMVGPLSSSSSLASTCFVVANQIGGTKNANRRDLYDPTQYIGQLSNIYLKRR